MIFCVGLVHEAVQISTGHMVELVQHLSRETALTHFFRKHKPKTDSSTPKESPVKKKKKRALNKKVQLSEIILFGTRNVHVQK